MMRDERYNLIINYLHSYKRHVKHMLSIYKTNVMMGVGIRLYIYIRVYESYMYERSTCIKI